MEVEQSDLPEIGDPDRTCESPTLVLESSPLKEDSKENQIKEPCLVKAKPKSGSWLDFGRVNLFNDDDDKDSNSSISLPDNNIKDIENNEEFGVLKLDGSSFIDETEIHINEEEKSSSNKPQLDSAEASEGETGMDMLKRLHKKKKSKKSTNKSLKSEQNEETSKDEARDNFKLEGLVSSEDENEANPNMKKSKKSKNKSLKNKQNEETGMDEAGDNTGLEGLVSSEDENEASPKRSKRLSKKELQKMQSDAQRVLREAPVSIPVRRSLPLDLDKILEEVASINPEVKKMLSEPKPKQEEQTNEPKESLPEVADDSKKQNETSCQSEISKDQRAEKIEDKPVVDDKKQMDIDECDGDDEIELEIVDEDEPLVEKPVHNPVNPGVAWLMQRFRKHNVTNKTHHVGHNDQNDGAASSPANWEEVKNQLQEEMAQLREKGLQERIQRFKMENEDLEDQEPEEEEAVDDPEDISDEDDSYTTITDEEETEEEKKERLEKKRAKEAKKVEKQAGTNAFLNLEAAETGSEDEDYQPSEGHREEGGLSTDDGSIGSDDEKVRSGSDGDESSDGADSDEISDDDFETSDEEEEMLRTASKKKRLKKRSKKKEKKAFDSEDDDDGDLPELVVEDRVVENESAGPQIEVEAVLEPSVASSASVIPPDMPKPNELFNIYNEGNTVDDAEEDAGITEMDDLLGLCTGPFRAVDSSKNETNDEIQEEMPVEIPDLPKAKKSAVVYGTKKPNSDKKQVLVEAEDDDVLELELPTPEENVSYEKEKDDRRKLMKQFFEEEAELSDSDEDARLLSSDEDEGGAENDRYETDSEFEDDALSKLTANQLKNQVGNIHMKQVIDEDERNLLHLREAIIPDADLADMVGPRLKRFRWATAWRDLGGTDMASQGENVHADDDYLGLAALDSAVQATGSQSSLWQKQRVERERWLQHQQAVEQEEEAKDDAESPTENSETLPETAEKSDLVKLGFSAMRKSIGANSSFSSTAASPSVGTDVGSSAPSAHRRVSHGSMLSWLHQKELDKIAQNVSGSGSNHRSRNSGFSAGGANPKPEELLAGSNFKSRSSAGPFIVMQDDSSSPGERKRKFESNSSASLSAAKRGKQQASSVFDFLS